MKLLGTFYRSAVGGAVGMGLTWAAGGAFVGVLIEGTIDPTGSILDVWVTALAVPGFLGGVVFFTVLRIAEGRRRFDDVSLPRSAAWGAVSGLLLGVLAVATGMATAIIPGLWLRTAVVIGSTTLLSAVAGSGSLLLARTAEGRLRGAG